jgi:2-polyprenyl-6-methoxyphenol hydroxylase-like FAD-dependent oxidoreductase
MTRRAVIVGAGIGGLAAGLALRRAGWQVRILEKSTSPRELGFALSLAPNAVLALRELGIADEVVAASAAVGAIEVRGDGGRPLRRFDVAAAVGQVPSVFALREVLHGALLAATDPHALALDSAVIDIRFTRSGAALVLADGRIEEGTVVIGADGVGSVVRRRLHPDEAPPRPSGYVAVRGVAYGQAPHLGGLTGVAYLAHGIEAAAFEAGSNAVYWYMSLLARHTPEPHADPHVIATRAAAGLDATIQTIVNATTATDIRLDTLLMRAPIADWGRGAVTLLGDAAHPVLPHTGQGAAQALEDAVALGLALAPPGDAAAALRRYERVRAARTRTLVLRGPRIAAFTTTRNPFLKALRTTVIRFAPAGRLASAFLLAKRRDPHRELRTQSI